MPDAPPPLPPLLGAASPHPNGARHRPGARPRRRRLLLALGVIVAGAWAFALWYSATRPTPEPLDTASQRLVVAACMEARDALAALAPVGGDRADERADRVVAENEVLTGMVTALRPLRPQDTDGRTAISGWLDDWDALVRARGDYADGLRGGGRGRLVLPKGSRGAPISVRMDEYAEIHALGACTTETLQAEVVEGERRYPE